MESRKISETNQLLKKAEGSSEVQEAFQKGGMNVIFVRNAYSGYLQLTHQEFSWKS